MSHSNHVKKKKSKRKRKSEGPPLFSEFGKKTKEFLVKGYSKGHIISISTHSDGGVSLTSTLTENGSRSTTAVAGAYTYKNSTFIATIDTNSKIMGTLTLSEKFLSSTKATASFIWPDYKSSKLKFRILQDHAAVAMSVALNQSPVINFSASVGTSSIAFGMEAEYKTDCSCFSKYTAGINMKSLNGNASIILANKGDLLMASYVHYLDQAKKNAAVVEFTQNLSKKKNTLTIGGSCAIDHQTVVKARLDDRGQFMTVLEYNIRPKSCLAISGEFNTNAFDKIPKIGLALALVL